MSTFDLIEKSIADFKSENSEAGKDLDDQLINLSCNLGLYNEREILAVLLGDNDVADEYFSNNELLHFEVREIQHAMINFFK